MLMTGTAIDTILSSLNRNKKRETGRAGGTCDFIKTRAGCIRFIDTNSDKPVLLTTPDAPCVIEHHLALIDQLSQSFRVICFEMPGSGFSYPSAKYSFKIAETADMILEFMDGLGIDKAALAFTCVNGLHAMNFASRFPDRVSHLALAQVPSASAMRDWTGHNVPTPLRIPYIGQIIGRFSAKILAERWFSMSLPRPCEHRAPMTHIALENMKSGGCFCLSSIVQGAERTPDEAMLGASAPTIMIYGDTDYSHRHTDFNTITETVPQAALIKYQGYGHFPHLERTDEYVSDLIKFVLN